MSQDSGGDSALMSDTMTSNVAAGAFGPSGDQCSHSEQIEDSPTAEISPGGPQVSGPRLAVDDSVEPHAMSSLYEVNLSTLGHADRARAVRTDPPAASHYTRAGPGTRKLGDREVAVGAVLRSRYVLEEVIATGGDSVVFRAQDLH